MLRELSVQNLALIEDVHVELGPGYCAWTGETGAGKSLLLTALSLVLGGKASAELVRAGKTEARAAAVFDLSDPVLRGEVETVLGGPLDDDPENSTGDGASLIITRRVSSQGRGSAQVNGLPVTVSTLQAVGSILLDIHGQSEGRALADPDRQRDLLDAHGGLASLIETYRERREEHETLRRRRLELIRHAHERQRERALLEFERDELAAADPKVGEADELGHEAHRLANAGALRSAATEGYTRLYEAERSAQGILETVARSLASLARSVPELAEAAETLERLADETREVAYTLRDLGRNWDDDPERLEEVETRLALYRRLASRFHCTPDELATKRADTEAKLATLDRDDADLAGLDAPLAAAWSALGEAAAALTAGRRKTAKAFAKAIQSRLRPLGLDAARVDVAIQTAPLGDDPTQAPPGPSGADRVEIVFSANPGEEPRPLRKVASGGELSRLTLAVKTVLASADRVPTLVFDEIDTGVGGRLGAVLGKTLAELSRHHQVICVTHLPQMASYADRQWVIPEAGRARSDSYHDRPDRGVAAVAELAAMLGATPPPRPPARKPSPCSTRRRRSVDSDGIPTEVRRCPPSCRPSRASACVPTSWCSDH
ncbi:MAG: DNA repair protein RecN [Isosphaeraceae bacterium]